MKKLMVAFLLVLAVVVTAVNVPVQPVLWYNIDEQLANVEPAGRAELIKLLVYYNLDPVINFTEYEIWENSQAFNTIKFTDPVTKGEIAAMLVKYLGLETDAIEYPINARMMSTSSQNTKQLVTRMVPSTQPEFGVISKNSGKKESQ